MKKILLIAGGSLLLLNFSCNKTSEGNKNVIKQENVTPEPLPADSLGMIENTAEGDDEIIENTVRYVAEDGSSALVTFKNSDTHHSISIRSNNKTISAPQKEALAKGAIYGDHDFEIASQNDSIIITQGDNVIKLKKARGQ